MLPTSFKLAHLSATDLTHPLFWKSFSPAEMHNFGMSYIPERAKVSGRIVHFCEVRCVNLWGGMRNCGVSWVHLCRQVNKGTAGAQVDTPLPQLCTLKISGWEERKMWRRRFMQIDGGAGVDVAADVWVQELLAPARVQHPAGWTHPNPKSQPSSSNVHLKHKCTLASDWVHSPRLQMPTQFPKYLHSDQSVPPVLQKCASNGTALHF